MFLFKLFCAALLIVWITACIGCILDRDSRKGLTVVLLLLLCACAQKPVAQAPVYNITLTDNSQWVIGDNNSAQSAPKTESEQVARPQTEARTEYTQSDAWVLYLLLMVALGTAGYLAYKKWWKL